jgi:hypothetical protein
MSKINEYFNLINDEVIDKFDFKKMNDKEVFDNLKNKTKELFGQVYGTYEIDFHDCFDDEGFAFVPAIIETEKGKTYVGLVELSIEDSGEHYDTIFFTDKGIVYQHELKEKGIADVVPYNYKTLVDVIGDIHSETFV